MLGRTHEAETILQHGGNPNEAIRLLLRLHNWPRALELALKHPRELSAVLDHRRKYLEAMNKPEYDKAFVKAFKTHAPGDVSA